MSNIDVPAVNHLSRFNRRQQTLIIITLTAALLLSVVVGSLLLDDEKLTTDFDQQNLAPSFVHPFGTNWLGQDMFTRVLMGLALSLTIGILASTISALIALTLGIAAAILGRVCDSIITWFVDLFLGIPHLVTIILITFMLGGGTMATIVAVALTHWSSLTRVIRAEVLQLRTTEFVQISRRLGRTRWWIARRHLLPHLLPQIFVGFILMVPHAILHEAAITFLGFGLSPHLPAIGILLSESTLHLLTGHWWLALFPGLALLIIVRTFYILGDNLRLLIDPHTVHE